MSTIRIFKYPLAIVDKQRIPIHAGALPISVQFQRGVLCLWAAVDHDRKGGGREVRIVGTGNPVDFPLMYYSFIGTVQDPATGLVWHVFTET